MGTRGLSRRSGLLAPWHRGSTFNLVAGGPEALLRTLLGKPVRARRISIHVAPALRAASTWAASSYLTAASRRRRAASSRLIGPSATSRAPSAAEIRLTGLLEATRSA